MPFPLAAKGAAVAVSVAAAVAMALYESPELRRYADDVRRRIAVALYSAGDGISPPDREPLFNRPEDAHGFMQSRAEPGVDADDETRRRQREELLYWNSVRLQREAEKEAEREAGERPGEDPLRRERLEAFEKEAERVAEMEVEREARERTGEDPVRREVERVAEMEAERVVMASFASSARAAPPSSFDDFLKPDTAAGSGAFVFSSTGTGTGTGTGTDARPDPEGLRRRGPSPSFYTNPFADEHQINYDEVAALAASHAASQPPPDADGSASDIYSATTIDRPEPASPASRATEPPSLIDVDSRATPTESSATLDRPLASPREAPAPGDGGDADADADVYMTAGQEDRAEAYASIQAWAAQSSGPSFYSPLPLTPAAQSLAASEPELVSEPSEPGEATPTDSASLAGSAVDVAEDARSLPARDVRSLSDGAMTPTSWTEVGSVSSEGEVAIPVHSS